MLSYSELMSCGIPRKSLLHQAQSIYALPASIHRLGMTPCCFPEIIQWNLLNNRSWRMLKLFQYSIRRIVVLLKNTVQVFRCNSDSWDIARVAMRYTSALKLKYFELFMSAFIYLLHPLTVNWLAINHSSSLLKCVIQIQSKE